MVDERPDTLEFIRTELQNLEQVPEPTMDSVAVADLKRILLDRTDHSSAGEPVTASPT